MHKKGTTESNCFGLHKRAQKCLNIYYLINSQLTDYIIYILNKMTIYLIFLTYIYPFSSFLTFCLIKYFIKIYFLLKISQLNHNVIS